MRRAGPGSRAAVLPIPTPNLLNAAGSTDKSDESEASSKKVSPPKKQFVSNPSPGLRAGSNMGGATRDGKAVGSRAHLLGSPSNRLPEQSQSLKGQSTDQYGSSASEVPDEMIRQGSHDSDNEEQSLDDEDEDENEKLKRKRHMQKIYKQYMKAYPERYEQRKAYFEKVASSKVLSRFQRPSPETLVECGYNTEHYNARLRKLEIASFLLHFLEFFFTVGYYELNYNQVYENYQSYLLYLLHGIAIYLCLTTYVRYRVELTLLKMRYKLSAEETLWSSHKRFSFVLEIIICLMHPQYYLHSKQSDLMQDAKLHAYNSIVKVYTETSWNDVMAVAGMSRVVLTALFAISISGQNWNRTKRVALLHGYELNFSNIIKTMIKEKPFSTLAVTFLISIVVFAYCLRICERPLTDITGDQPFTYLSSSVWVTVITMMTGKLLQLTQSVMVTCTQGQFQEE
jgi:hypothetical protein